MKELVMTKALKEKWCEALRSGNYIQGKNKLRQYSLEYNQTEFCCMGVLDELLDGKARRYQTDPESGSSTPLHSSLISEYQQKTLSVLNDGEYQRAVALSFNEIADWIEKNISTVD